MNELYLKALVESGLSQREIGKKTGRSQTNVRYWLTKFNLVPPPKIKRKCLRCGSPTKRNNSTFCSSACFSLYSQQTLIDQGQASSRTCRSFLLKTKGHKCETCGLSEWMGSKIPLEMDHMDGNHKNNSLSNLRLLCPNCHAQTDTWKSKNKGKGRAYRSDRYKQGKSY